VWHERDDFNLRLVARAVNAGLATPANAQLRIPSCAQATSTPAGRAERAVEAQPMVAESVDVAEHSATLDGAMDGGLLQVLQEACAPPCMTCTCLE
jgi:hypothetical protein